MLSLKPKPVNTANEMEMAAAVAIVCVCVCVCAVFTACLWHLLCQRFLRLPHLGHGNEEESEHRKRVREKGEGCHLCWHMRLIDRDFSIYIYNMNKTVIKNNKALAKKHTKRHCKWAQNEYKKGNENILICKNKSEHQLDLRLNSPNSVTLLLITEHAVKQLLINMTM